METSNVVVSLILIMSMMVGTVIVFISSSPFVEINSSSNNMIICEISNNTNMMMMKKKKEECLLAHQQHHDHVDSGDQVEELMLGTEMKSSRSSKIKSRILAEFTTFVTSKGVNPNGPASCDPKRDPQLKSCVGPTSNVIHGNCGTYKRDCKN